jgi:hypothetical protein
MIRLPNGLLARKKVCLNSNVTMKIRNNFRSGKIVGQALVLCNGTSNVASALYRCATRRASTCRFGSPTTMYHDSV